MKLKTHEGGDSLQDLSKQKLIGLLKSTYEYKSLGEYFDDHDLVFLDCLQEDPKMVKAKSDSAASKHLSEYQMMGQLQRINEQQGLGLHKYHQDLIFAKFKKYYDKFQTQKTHKIRTHFQNKLRKVQKEAQSYLPQDLMEVCLEKQKELTRQIKRRRNKNIKM